MCLGLSSSGVQSVGKLFICFAKALLCVSGSRAADTQTIPELISYPDQSSEVFYQAERT